MPIYEKSAQKQPEQNTKNFLDLYLKLRSEKFNILMSIAIEARFFMH